MKPKLDDLISVPDCRKCVKEQLGCKRNVKTCKKTVDTSGQDKAILVIDNKYGQVTRRAPVVINLEGKSTFLLLYVV